MTKFKKTLALFLAMSMLMSSTAFAAGDENTTAGEGTSIEETSGIQAGSDQGSDLVGCAQSEDCAAETHVEGCPKYVVPSGNEDDQQTPAANDGTSLTNEDAGLAPRENYVTMIGGQGYASLQEAINAVGNTPALVTLLCSVNEPITIAEGQTITLDLGSNGYTLADAAEAQDSTVDNASRHHTITNYGTLTIMGRGTVDNKSHGRDVIYNEGTLTINNGSYTRSAEKGTLDGGANGNSWYFFENFGTMTISGMTATSEGTYSSMLRNGRWDDKPTDKEGTLIINEGTILRNGNTAVKNEKGSLTVSGGTLVSTSAAFSVVNYATAELKGGYYTDSGSNNYALWHYSDATTIITGGVFAPQDHTIETVKQFIPANMAMDENSGIVHQRGLNDEGTVAQVGGRYYNSLQAAIDATQNGSVTMLANTTESVTVAAGKDITLNIPANVILTNGDGENTITNNGTLTITGEGTVDNVSHRKAALLNNGTLVLNGGTYSRSAEASVDSGNSGDNSYYTIDNKGNMTINDGVKVMASENNSGKFSSLIRNLGNEDGSKGILTINGGTFTGGLNTVKNDDYGNMTIKGGIFSNTSQHVVMNWNKGTITGGTFTATAPAAAAIWNGSYGNMATGNLTITGGSFTGTPAVTNSATYTGGTITISNGTFSSDVGDYCANGYKSEYHIGNKNWAVSIDTAATAATIGTTAYPTLQDALAAAQPGDTVVLQRDITVDYSGSENGAAILIPNGVHLDGRGNTIKADNFTSDGHVVGINGSKNVTISNLTIVGTKGSEHGKHCLNVWGGAQVQLHNVTLKNSLTAGMVINNSTVGANGLTTSGNGWYGVNADHNSTFKVSDFTSDENIAVFSEDAGINGSTIIVPDSYAVLHTANGTVYGTESNIKNEETVVAKVGNEYFTSLQDAIDMGGTVTLLRDVTANVTVANGQTVTLDLNGKTLNGDLAAQPKAGTVLTNNGTLTIRDSSTSKAGTITRDESQYTGDHKGHDYIIANNGTLIIEGGEITSQCSREGNPPSTIINGGKGAATLTINGGKVTHTSGIAIKNDEYGTFTMTGGEVSTDAPTFAAILNWKNAAVSGGKISGITAVQTLTYGSTDATTSLSGNVDVTGNLLNKKYDDGTQNTPKTQITGGTYSIDVTEYCAEGYLPIRRGDKYVVEQLGESNAEARIGTGNTAVYYTSLAEAVAAATANQTVTLLNNVALSEKLTINKAITLDGNDKTITSTVTDGQGTILVTADEVKIQKLTITANGTNPYTHGIQVNGAEKVTLTGLNIRNMGKDALLVNNGSDVTATDLTTSGNTWGAVNVDHGSAFALNGTINIGEDSKVWSEDYGKAGGSTVRVDGFVTVYGLADGKVHFTTAEAAEGKREVIARVGTSQDASYPITYYTTLADAFAAVNDSANSPALFIMRDCAPTGNEQLVITRNSVTLYGLNNGNNQWAKIDCGSYTCSGQAGILIQGDNVQIHDLRVTSNATNAVKVTYPDGSGRTVENFSIQNVTLTSTAGHGLNLHGVNGASIMDTELNGSKCGLSLANATGVTVSGTKLTGTRGSVGMMWANQGFETPVTLTLTDSNEINGVIYSERKDGRYDTVTLDSAQTADIAGAKVVNSNRLTTTMPVKIEKNGGSFYFSTLAQAIAAASAGDTITLLDNVTLSEKLTINKAITLDGNSQIITSTVADGQGTILVTADGATIKSLTITANANAKPVAHGIQVNNAKNVTLTGLNISNMGKDALLVNNGAAVTATDLTTSGNTWGAVNVDKASSFTYHSGNLEEDVKIWVDDTASTVTVPNDWKHYTVVKDGKTQTFYTTDQLSISLSLATLEMTVGYTVSTPVQLEVSGTPDGATVVWRSSAENVASVANGVVTAHAAGTATITATVGSMTARCTVSVTNTTDPTPVNPDPGPGPIGPVGPVNPDPSTDPDEGEEDLDDNDTPLVERPFTFVDVIQNRDWFYNDVKTLFERGLINGMGTNAEGGEIFSPYTTATRAMVATMLYRMAGSPSVEDLDITIVDVGPKVWYHDAAVWAYANGVFGGYKDGSFQGKEIITREQLAAVLHRYAAAQGMDVSARVELDGFADADRVSKWALEDMKWAVAVGLIGGRNGRQLAAKDSASRAELATLIVRFDSLLANAEDPENQPKG